MGVNNLWPILEPAKQTCLLGPFATAEAFDRKRRSFLGGHGTLRVGVDISIWMDSCSAVFHKSSMHTQAGENPELRALFFRLCHLLRAPITPIFVFDGPGRPEEKRGRLVKSGQPLWITSYVKTLISAFGFKFYEAPGEAEAELAALNQRGLIDIVITDDCDAFTFGAECVLRSRLTDNGPRIGGARVAIYTADAIENSDVGLTCGGLILISLLVGGDYNRGVEGIGMGIALGLARCGYGDELLEAAQTLSPASLEAFLVNWGARIKQELYSNAHGYLRSTHPMLAENITDDFPNRRILGLYVQPLTSWSGIGTGLGDHVSDMAASWHSREPSIQNITSFCRLHFGWSDFSKLLDVFQGNLWDGVLCRMLFSPVPFYDSNLSQLISPNNKTTIIKISNKPRHIKISTQKTGLDYFKLTVSIGNFLALTGSPTPYPTSLKSVDAWIPQQVMEAAGITTRPSTSDFMETPGPPNNPSGSFSPSPPPTNVALLASTSGLNDAAIAPTHDLGLNLFRPSPASILHLNQMPPQDGGTKVKCEEEVFAQPARKRWYIDLTDSDEGTTEYGEKKKSKKSSPKHDHESEVTVIDLT